MPRLTAQQRAFIRRRTKVRDIDPSEMMGELNIVPFLDIVVNVIMFLLATTEAVLAITQIEAQLPQLKTGARASTGAKTDLGLNLSVTLTDNGIVVAGSGGKLAPGCSEVSAGRVMTVPKRGTSYDWAGLIDCAKRIKEVPDYADEHEVILGADPMVQYEHVVAAMDALRGGAGNELFPDVLLSAGVR